VGKEEVVTYNTELFKQINQQITQYPQLHDQRAWWGVETCGTTYCVGGWALHFTNPDQSLEQTATDLVGWDDEGDSVARAARTLLGLDPHEAHQLFYDTENEQATALVRYYASGGEGDRPLELPEYSEEDLDY
jgi:hypothetical protein